MQTVRPASPEQLAEALRAAASESRSILLGGRFSKDRLGGRACPAEIAISTCAMNRLLRYDPRDLTIGVEAGMAWADLERILAERGQMLPLDPGWAAESTVGGVVAANLSGPRRRLYGTARDMIIGMTFATLEGKLVRSGGNVVKNVAGLDMAKLMIGSFGTLAAIAAINFKVFPVPAESRTFVMEFETIAEAFAERDRILQSALQPAAIDIVNWPRRYRDPSLTHHAAQIPSLTAGAGCERRDALQPAFSPAPQGGVGYRLLMRAAGSAKVVERYARELARARTEDDSIWEEVREFTARFLARNPEGGVVPMISKLSEMAALAEKLQVPFVARAGSGVIYAHYAENPIPALTGGAESRGLNPPPLELGGDLGGDFAMMTKVKEMFDPERLLNRGRLYGRI
jgi:glycolate oxidase FAD binding subunit